MLDNIKSVYIIKIIVLNLDERIKLELIKYEQVRLRSNMRQYILESST